MQLSPLVAELEQYPFARLDDWRADARARGIDVIDFGVGDPREPTPAFIRDALVAGMREVSSYPRAVGLPEYREAVAAWIERRFGVRVDPAAEIVPTLGSKEAIFSMAQLALGERRVVAVPEPGYPVYERGALFAGAEVVTVPLREDDGWLPDLDAFTAWDEIGLFWTCYPNNPTGATAPLSFYEELAARAREHGFLLCSDEAYSELWFGEQPVSALQVADRENVVVFSTLSKRSSMTGYRCGFVCAPRDVAGALRAFRPSVGHGSAGVRAARGHRGVRRRGARGRGARGVPPEAGDAAPGARGEGAPTRGRRRDVLPLAGRRRAVGDLRAAPARRRASSSLRARSSARPARAM